MRGLGRCGSGSPGHAAWIEVSIALAAILGLIAGAGMRTAPTLWSAPCWSGLRWMRGQDLNL